MNVVKFELTIENICVITISVFSPLLKELKHKHESGFSHWNLTFINYLLTCVSNMYTFDRCLKSPLFLFFIPRIFQHDRTKIPFVPFHIPLYHQYINTLYKCLLQAAVGFFLPMTLKECVIIIICIIFNQSFKKVKLEISNLYFLLCNKHASLNIFCYF